MEDYVPLDDVAKVSMTPVKHYMVSHKRLAFTN